jgi:drug/metabolite transporter (DMT)-like permease
VLLSALGYAAAALFYKRRFTSAQPLGVVTLALAVSAIAFLVPAAADLPASTPSGDAVAALVGLGSVNTGVGFWLFYTLIDEAGAGRALVITYVMPGVAVVLGILVLSEPFTAGTAVGLALILGGTVLATAREGRTPKRVADVSCRP